MNRYLYLLITLTVLISNSCATSSIMNFSKKEEPKHSVISGQFSNQTVIVTGKGITSSSNNDDPKNSLMAERAAIIDGYRLLTEKISGILLETYSLTDNYNISKDQIAAQAKSFVKGAEIIGVKHLKNGVVEADIKLILPQNLISATANY